MKYYCLLKDNFDHLFISEQNESRYKLMALPTCIGVFRSKDQARIHGIKLLQDKIDRLILDIKSLKRS